MSEELITSGAENAEVSTPSTETQTTETTTTETQTVATPTESNVTEIPKRGENEDAAGYLKRVAAERIQREEAAAAKAKPAEPAKVEPAKAVEPPKQETKEEAKVEETKPDEQQEAEQIELEESGPLPTSKLAEALKSDPELAQKLEAAGLKDDLFKTARIAAKVSKYEELFPGGVEDAQFLRGQALQFSELDDKFTGVQDAQTAKDFLGALLPFSYVLDGQGNPIPDGRGGYVTDGTVERFMDNLTALSVELRPDYILQGVIGSEKGREVLMNELAKLGGSDDEELQAALDILKERTSRGPSSASESQSSEAKALAQERARIEAEKQTLIRQREESAQAKEHERSVALATEISVEMDKYVDAILNNPALKISDFNKRGAKQEIRDGIYKAIEADPTFKAQMAQLARRQWSSEVHKQRVAETMRAVRSVGAKVYRPILKEAGAEVIRKQEEKQQKIDTQIRASKSETKVSTPASAPAKMTDAEIRAQAVENLKKQNRDYTDTRTLMLEMKRLQASGQ